MSRGSRALVVIGLGLLAWPALAHPVPIGRYGEIPYGVDPGHPLPTAHGGPRRTGRVRGVAPSAAPVLGWTRALPHRRPRGPTIASDGTLYVGTMGGLSALGPDGVERWSVSLDNVDAPPSLVPGGDIVVATRAGRVVRVSREGVVRRRAALGAAARGATLVLDDGSILIGTIDGRLHRLDASLRSMFSIALGGHGARIAQAAPDRLAVLSGSTLTLLHPSGRIEHEAGLGGRARSTAAIADDGTVWAVTHAGVLVAVEPDGRVRSRTPLGSRVYDGVSPVIGHDGAVRVPTLSEGVVCVGPSGTVRWRLANPAGYNAPASIDDQDTLLVVDRGGRLQAITADGGLRWHVALGTYSFQAPALGSDGTLYVTTEQGEIRAWRTSE